jgi:hypothetical protein
MSYSLSLTQKVNAYLSVTFILLFGFLLTFTVVNAIERDAPYLQYLSAPALSGN